MPNRTSIIAVAVSLLAPCFLMAQDAHYIKGEDGLTYRETRQVVNHVVPETRLEERQSVTYQTKYTTDLKETQRAYMAPVTEYQWTPHLDRGWNPFAQPVLTYRLTPQTRWETRVETVRIPVTNCQVIPETRTVQVPVTTSRIAQGEIVTRTPVASNAIITPVSKTSTATASKSWTSSRSESSSDSETVGGLHDLSTGDPPRRASNSGAVHR